MKLLGNKPSAEKIFEIVSKYQSNGLGRGASWNGLDGEGIGALVFMGVILTFAAAMLISCGGTCEGTSSDENNPYYCESGCIENTDGTWACWSCEY